MNEYNVFNVIMGAKKKTVIENFGNPDLNFFSLFVYKKATGKLVILFEDNEVKAFALYDNDNKLLHKIGIEPLADSSEIKALEKAMDAEELTENFGEPHFDVGSGTTRYGYFTQDDVLIVPNGVSGVKSILNY